MLLAPKVVGNLNYACFASQFTKLERSLDKFDPSAYALPRTDEGLLVTQPWSQRPFDKSQELKMPIYSFITGRFANEYVSLDHDIFNLPLRRDIVHFAHEYFEHKGKSIWKRVKTLGDVAGSGKKPAPQKGRGAAR